MSLLYVCGKYAVAKLRPRTDDSIYATEWRKFSSAFVSCFRYVFVKKNHKFSVCHVLHCAFAWRCVFVVAVKKARLTGPPGKSHSQCLFMFGRLLASAANIARPVRWQVPALPSQNMPILRAVYRSDLRL